MGDPTQLSRLSLRRDQVLEFDLCNWPEPPPELLKMPGFNTWWQHMLLTRERDRTSFKKLFNNLGIATSTP